jgi:asparagine synthetase B (glutamine-hydrolysing)
MNILLGTSAIAPRPSDLSGALKSIESAYGISLHARVNETSARAWAAEDGGVLLGNAQTDSVHLLLLGTLHHPLPGWSGGAPVDDPRASARYLLDRYLSQGLKVLDGVTGQYGIVICEPARQRVLLASDPLGHRTIYWSGDANHIAYSTNLYTLTRLLSPALKLDRSLEDFLLLYGFLPWGRTPFEGITAVAKGTILEWNAGRVSCHAIESRNPWLQRFQQDLGDDQGRVVDALYEGFMLALREQLTDDQRVGVLLGGFDSALVAAALHRLGKTVETFSFCYDDARYNQPHVDTLQKFLGHEHHWVKLTQQVLTDGLREFSLYFNQPTNWPNYVIQTADVCGLIRSRGIRFCYTGDGCDSVFMGYPGTYRRAVLFESLPRLPANVTQLLLRIAARPRLERRMGHPYRVGLNMLRALGREMPARGYLSFRVMDETSVAQLRQGESPAQQLPPEEIGRQLAEPHRGAPSLRLAYLGKSAVSPNRNKMVGSSDRFGIGILSPYLHPGLKQLSLALPEELCRPSQRTKSAVTGKYILMKMAEEKQLLPPEVIYQRKVAAVDGPIDAWYAGPLRPLMLRLMEGLPFEYSRSYANALLDEKVPERLFKRHIMTDKVISHAASLAATYATFTALAKV